MVDTALNKKIVHTLLYYDLFDYPLTGVELWQYVISKERYGLAEVLEAARNNKEIVEEHGFFCLKKREAIINQRKIEYLFALKQRRKMQKWLPCFKVFPCMKGLFLSGPIALDVSRENSDIDIFSVTAVHRLWTARFFVVMVLKIFRQRPGFIPVLGKKKGSNRGKFCFSMWCTEADMDLQRYALSDNDIHFALWLKHLSPIWTNGDNVYKKFVQTNTWVRQYGEWLCAERKGFSRSIIARCCELVLSIIPDGVFERIEWHLLPRLTRQKALGSGTDVVVSHECAKLHITDRREEYNRAWRGRIQAYERTESVV
ncbi:MAG: hypothetical protein UV70_C0005G0106 [Parcubacteria group bacterium GW2011_GWA2_43_13]|nr:MAG: hypothetical protein UV70_C0005G0106 [Parcubacteria group bacterium GW2011_GWA2_43_13]OGY69459.1 MAG: hypothetical protein A3B94_03235 [Candidatus Jacksonbacteria bacterium RIFCSPHIGHO2_02_FULL_43_10]OGY71340.1 MAG: hypothetical protein A2986_03700 [Candidatus Jacksonbacteria bacterium RIFCSPLOWO2_01_FULL_44_13]HAZ17035.1 hypothetical protein [Candidatus Jacksonbacteria bacterium]